MSIWRTLDHRCHVVIGSTVHAKEFKVGINDNENDEADRLLVIEVERAGIRGAPDGDVFPIHGTEDVRGVLSSFELANDSLPRCGYPCQKT